MANRLKIFNQLTNVFRFNNVKSFKSIYQTQNLYFYSTTATYGGVFKRLALILGSLGIGSGVYSYLTAPDRKKRSLDGVTFSERNYVVDYNIPEIKPSRVIAGPAVDFNLDLTIYQYQTCPFCCKVRAFLEFYGIPFKVVEVNPVMRQQTKFSSYRKVPIVIAEDKKDGIKFQLNDSTAIVSILGTFLMDSKDKLERVLKYYTANIYKDNDGKDVEDVLNKYFLMFGDKALSDRTEELIKKERHWRKWADSELVHMLCPNIYRTYDEALQAFKYFSEVGEWEKNFATWERLVVIYVGATAMYFIGKRLKKRHALKDNVRQSLYESCNKWTKAIGKNKFLGGDLPNLADLAVYGLLSSIEGCIAFTDLLEQTNVGPWYYNVKEAVSSHAGYQLIR